ncbi:neuromedin-K receptor-like [Actinia tenebrosa]|uniref:Neuromedin-K receptor-like n=1 Tax=Actinia tenebrosa TaxID=6105 RepID=A0A6P8HF76_ACTTE|nr:neuromedin-K receptor-like [Actinia tenebrosa]
MDKSLLFSIFACVLVSIAVAGNLLIVIAVWKKRFLRSTTNYLLVNVAFSDLVSLCFLPLMLTQRYVKFNEGVVADMLCKFLISFNIPLTASFAAICTLVVLSVERYHAIVKPMKTGFRLREDTVKYAIGSCWLCAGLATLPLYIYGKYSNIDQRNLCITNLFDLFPLIYILHVSFFFVAVPFITISFCYFKIVHEVYFKNKVGPKNLAAQQETLNKRKLVKLSLSITITFVICFFPVTIAVILKSIDPRHANRSLVKYTSVLYFLESLCNPFLYAYQSTNFRQAFKAILKL